MCRYVKQFVINSSPHDIDIINKMIVEMITIIHYNNVSNDILRTMAVKVLEKFHSPFLYGLNDGF